jgi:hypothetical protein
MKYKKVYYIYVPSLNMSFVAYNLNQLKEILYQLKQLKLKYYIQEKVLFWTMWDLNYFMG